MKPYAYNPRRVPTVWADYGTGRGVTDTGAVFRVPVRDRRRTRPTVLDVLDAARAEQLQRVYLTGAQDGRPVQAWLLAATPGWRASGHYLDHDVPVGRFEHVATGERVEVRRAAEWFGEGPTPEQARGAADLLGALYRRSFGDRALLLASPAGTGLDAWARTLAPDDLAEQLDDETAELVRATAPQHRVELFTPTAHRAECGDCLPLVTAATVPGFVYLDGRMMYGALTRELGTVAGAEWLDEDSARAMLSDPRGRYTRARVQLRFMVPDGWTGPGLFMVPLGTDVAADDDRRWHAPNRPGFIGECWADTAEIDLALTHGWHVRPLRALRFGKGRPLDKWTERLVAMRERADTADADPLTRALVRDAVRAMLLYGIGAFHSRGRDVTHVTDTPLTIPAGVNVTEPTPGLYVWRERVETQGRQRAFAHPEWSAQVWGRAHARLLHSPTGDREHPAGVLHVPPAQLLGVYGDAVYLTTDPGWPDDGRIGRLRRKGALPGPLPTPTTAEDRNRLRAQAERYTA